MTLRRVALGLVCCSLSLASYSIWTTQVAKSGKSVAFAATEGNFSFPDEPTDRSPEEYQGSFLYTNLDDMLAHLDVTVYPEDKVFAFPEPGLGLGSRIKVYRAQPVVIRDGAQDTLVRTWSKTVGEVLDESGIEVGEQDTVTPSRDLNLEIGGTTPMITITRVAVSEVKEKEVIAYTTKTVNDPDLEKGKTVKEQAGKNGTLEKTYTVRRENGVEVSRVLTSKKTLTEPVQEIIHKGTKVVDYGSGKASWYYGVAPMTAAHRTLPKGTKVRVVNTATGASVVVTIADRGPYVAGRIIDLSDDAFAKIASKSTGVISVRLEKVY